MKTISIKKLMIILIGAIAALCIIAFIAIMALRIDSFKASEIALQKTNGGQIVQEEIDNEGLWNEYKYTIVNSNMWYEIEISGFGNIKEMETSYGNT